jgi:hypothetical protein
MNWRLVLVLGVTFGLTMGLVGILGSPMWTIRWTLAIVVVISAIIISRAGGTIFANGFLTGFISGLFETGLFLVLWNQFISCNPGFLTALNCSSSQFRNSVLIALIPWSIILGLVIGLFSLLVNKLNVLGKRIND